MKNLIISTFVWILMCIVSSVLLFVSFAFSIWDVNPSNWEPFTRGMFVYTSIAFFIIEAILASYINEKLEKNNEHKN